MITMTDLKKGDSLYLGDGAYVNYDGFGFWLATTDGVDIQNRVYLEPDVCHNFVDFANSRLNKNKVVEPK